MNNEYLDSIHQQEVEAAKAEWESEKQRAQILFTSLRAQNGDNDAMGPNGDAYRAITRPALARYESAQEKAYDEAYHRRHGRYPALVRRMTEAEAEAARAEAFAQEDMTLEEFDAAAERLEQRIASEQTENAKPQISSVKKDFYKLVVEAAVRVARASMSQDEWRKQFPANGSYYPGEGLAEICRHTAFDTALSILRDQQRKIAQFGDKAYPLTENQNALIQRAFEEVDLRFAGDKGNWHQSDILNLGDRLGFSDEQIQGLLVLVEKRLGQAEAQ